MGNWEQQVLPPSRATSGPNLLTPPIFKASLALLSSPLLSSPLLSSPLLSSPLLSSFSHLLSPGCTGEKNSVYGINQTRSIMGNWKWGGGLEPVHSCYTGSPRLKCCISFSVTSLIRKRPLPQNPDHYKLECQLNHYMLVSHLSAQWYSWIVLCVVMQ